MKGSRPAVSSAIALLVVVIIIAAAFYVEIPMAASSSTTSTSLSISTASSTTSSTTPAGSTGTLTISTPQPLIVAPDQSEVVTLRMTAIGSVSGNFTFSASALPSGVTATFQPGSLSLPSGLHTGVTMTLSAATGATVVNSTASVVATAGSTVYKSSIPIESVQALVLIQGGAFQPNTLTVSTGTKVYWMSLDAVGGEVGVSTGHDVTALDGSFSSGTGDLVQYSMYGHTFATAGTVQYKSAAQPSMTGSITVTG